MRTKAEVQGAVQKVFDSFSTPASLPTAAFVVLGAAFLDVFLDVRDELVKMNDPLMRITRPSSRPGSY